MSTYPNAALPDVLLLQRGFDLPATDRRGGSYPVVASTSMVGFHDTAMVDGPGVVIGRSGSIGGAQWIDSDFWPLNTTLWVKDFRGNDARWVYYLLRSIDFTGYNVGSGVPTLNRNHLTHISVPVPSLSEQRAIAEVLGALDDKIEANNAVRDLADCTWRALLNQARAESEWVPVPLSSLARFINGKAYTKNATGTGRMVVRIAELNSGPGGSTVYNDIDVPSESLAQPGDLLFAWSGSLTVQRWHRPAAIINQHIFKVLPNGDTPLWLLHGLLLDLLPYFQGIASGKATTMGHIQRHHLDEPVPFPLPAKMSDLDRICAPLWQRALATEQESLVLEQLRDALLPKLLSGELRVRDAEALVGGAV